MSAEPALLSLDDAAAMLIPLEGDDQAGIQRVQDALAAAASGDPVTAAALAAAAGALRQALGAAAADAALAIERAGSELEAAMAASDRAGRR